MIAVLVQIIDHMFAHFWGKVWVDVADVQYEAFISLGWASYPSEGVVAPATAAVAIQAVSIRPVRITGVLV